MIECKVCGNTQMLIELDAETSIEREGDLPKLPPETTYRVVQVNCSKCLAEIYCFLHGWFAHVDIDRKHHLATQNLDANLTQCMQREKSDKDLLEMIDGVNYEDLIALLQKGKHNEAK